MEDEGGRGGEGAGVVGGEGGCGGWWGDGDMGGIGGRGRGWAEDVAIYESSCVAVESWGGVVGGRVVGENGRRGR